MGRRHGQYLLSALSSHRDMLYIYIYIYSRRDERLFPASRCVTQASLRANRCDRSQAEPRKELLVFGEGKQPPENTFTSKHKAMWREWARITRLRGRRDRSRQCRGGDSPDRQTDRQDVPVKKNKRHSSIQVQPGDWSIIQRILGGRRQLLSTGRTGRRSYWRSVPWENKMYFYPKNKPHPFFVLPLTTILCCIWLQIYYGFVLV